MMAAFGVGFLAPLLVVFLQLVEVVTPRTLLRQWRIAILVILIVAAVITPSGDPVSLAALAVPMIVLYALAIAVGSVVLWRRRRRASNR
jgi:sec-independent protein translocase protein TatC